MSKRFTETDKWKDQWFRKLSPLQKCLWMYLVDNCDQAGVIDLDLDLASFQIGEKVAESDVESLSKGIERLSNGKIWLKNFIKFQYGQISRSCKPHTPVFIAIERHGIMLDKVMNCSLNGDERLSKPIEENLKGFQSLQEKEKEKEKDKEEDKEKEKEECEEEKHGKHALQIRAEKLVNRRESTPWDAGEIRAWRANREVLHETSEDEWQVLEWFYKQPKTDKSFHRTGLAQIVNNWRGEITKAQRNRDAPSNFIGAFR